MTLDPGWCELIGGPRDGEVTFCERNELPVPMIDDMPSKWWGPPKSPSESPEFRVGFYVRRDGTRNLYWQGER